MKTKITINNTDELKDFLKRNDVTTEIAFDITKTFLNVREPDIKENLSFCFVFSVINGTGKPNFSKVDIINWIDNYNKEPYNCFVIFGFK